MKLSRILIYPIKSLAPIDVSSRWSFGEYGLKYDHEWMIVRASDGRFISQRTFPQLALLKTSFGTSKGERGFLKVEKPLGDTLLVSVSNTEGERREVSVHDDYGITAVDQGDTDASFFSDFIKTDVRFVRIAPESDRKTPTGARIAFHDGWPILVLSAPTVEDIAARGNFDPPLTAAAFRPQLLLGDCEAYAEDGIRRMETNSVRFEGQTLCIRCPIPDIVAETGERRPNRPVTKVLETCRWGTKPNGKKGVFVGRNMTFEILAGPNTSFVVAGQRIDILETDAGIDMYRR